jgi:hypothetical protein
MHAVGEHAQRCMRWRSRHRLEGGVIRARRTLRQPQPALAQRHRQQLPAEAAVQQHAGRLARERLQEPARSAPRYAAPEARHAAAAGAVPRRAARLGRERRAAVGGAYIGALPRAPLLRQQRRAVRRRRNPNLSRCPTNILLIE